MAEHITAISGQPIQLHNMENQDLLLKMAMVFGPDSPEVNAVENLISLSVLANPWRNLIGDDVVLPEIGVPVRCIVVQGNVKVMQDNELTPKLSVKTLYFNGLYFADRDGNTYGNNAVTHWKNLEPWPEA